MDSIPLANRKPLAGPLLQDDNRVVRIEAARADAAALHHSLGLALVRQGESLPVLIALQKAVELDPNTARYAYVNGVALNSTGRAEIGISVLTKTHKLHPGNRDILFALSTINRDMGRTEKAVSWARKLLTLNSAVRGAQQLLQSLSDEG